MNLRSKLLNSKKIYLTDGGLETTLIFQDNVDLPYFASFVLMNSEEGQEQLKKYYRNYLDLAKKHKTNFILETPTWRASSNWADLLGYNSQRLDTINNNSVLMLQELQKEYSNCIENILISGCLGPHGDGYSPDHFMSPEQASNYHHAQIASFAHAGVDMVNAMTLTYPEEAIGIVKKAQKYKLPISISFTVETNGYLINGMSLQQAIKAVDTATQNGPVFYMINCAHPDHFSSYFTKEKKWQLRLGGIRANASRLSHEELDECTQLDSGNPVEFGQLYKDLTDTLPHLKVFGGCCGTNQQHIDQICSQNRVL